jgi:hypothetical protein
MFKKKKQTHKELELQFRIALAEVFTVEDKTRREETKKKTLE